MIKNPNFQNNRINRWIEKLQEYDFDIKYINDETMGQQAKSVEKQLSLQKRVQML